MGEQADVKKLELEAAYEYVFPDDYPLAGASAGSLGSTWIWAAADSVVGKVSSASSIQWFTLGYGVVPVSVEQIADDTIEVFDAGNNQIVTLALSTARRQLRPLDLTGTVTSAIRHSNGSWCVTTRDSTTQLLLHIDKKPAQLFASVLRGPGDGFTISKRKGETLISFRDPKRPALWASPSGEMRTLSSPSRDPKIAEILQDTLSLWRSIGTLSLHDEFLYTFANFRGDERMLIVADSNGAFQRKTIIPVAIAFLSSDDVQQRIIAARRLNNLALISYKWRWLMIPNTKQE